MYSILIIEDDSEIRSNMNLILNLEGFSVTVAGDGMTGLGIARNISPDLILCDILMPSMDGHSFLEQLKSEPALADTPFIFVTALGERSDVRRGMLAGADDYLPKPFTAEELVATVTGRLRRLEALRLNNSDSGFKKEQAVLTERITTREREVLLLVGRGATSRDISEQLGISIRTVEVHRFNLMDKLGAANAALLARWAMIAEQM